MKHLITLIVFALAFTSCEKKEVTKLCPIVAEKALPAVVASAFQQKYPGVTAQKWFNKDNKGYCALATINGTKELIQFDNNGTFIKEETDLQQQGDNQDDEDDGEDDCECETD